LRLAVTPPCRARACMSQRLAVWTPLWTPWARTKLPAAIATQCGTSRLQAEPRDVVH
jgi:hypothetical protein